MKRHSHLPGPVLIGLALLVVLVGLPLTASASPYLRVQPSFQIVNWTTGTSRTADPGEYYKGSATGPLSAGTGLVYFDGASAEAAGYANYGSLGFYAYSLSLDNGPAPGYEVEASAGGGAEFTDTFTIDNATLAGKPGKLSVYVDITGSITGGYLHPGVVGGQYWTVQLGDSYYSQVSSWDWATNSGRSEYHGFLGQNVDFIYGQPFDLRLVFSASASNPYWLGSLGIADYLHTMKLNMGESLVLDATGAPVDYTLTAASGHDYFEDSTKPVPEPASLLLLASGLVGCAAKLRRSFRMKNAE